jgi:hypothetical protein
MIDIYLKATTRAALVKKLIAAGLMVDDAPADGVALDEIGEIDGITGYHANVRLAADLTDEQITALGTTIVATPQTPYRVWA